jgi:hypothetical protein
MTTPTHTFRPLAIVSAAFAAAALTAPFAAADPPTVPLPISAGSTPSLGEQLSGQDRSWLPSRSQGNEHDLGALDPLIADAIRAYQGRALDLGALDPLIADAIRADRGRSGNSEDRSLPSSVAEQRYVTRTPFTHDGFRWTDAGVGAGSALVLVLICGGTTALVCRHRRRLSAQHGS